jgi:hypothetical protein
MDNTIATVPVIGVPPGLVRYPWKFRVWGMAAWTGLAKLHRNQAASITTPYRILLILGLISFSSW